MTGWVDFLRKLSWFHQYLIVFQFWCRKLAHPVLFGVFWLTGLESPFALFNR